MHVDKMQHNEEALSNHKYKLCFKKMVCNVFKVKFEICESRIMKWAFSIDTCSSFLTNIFTQLTNCSLQEIFGDVIND